MRHIARWDLDKTYLRTEFDTLRDLVRTAFERPDEKRTNPGAASLLREMARAGNEVHILSGSPEQMRPRLEEKLRIDGVAWSSFVLKPNLRNLLRLRFRALRDQLGYKLPMLLSARNQVKSVGDSRPRESLFGDDAEADAFIYSLYADILAGRVGEAALLEICLRGRLYPDDTARVLSLAALLPKDGAVERVLIHLEGQTPPSSFFVYGRKVVPFYNYLQAALVLLEDSRISAEGVLRVASELVLHHRFDGEQLARSYRELARRGHLRGARVDEVVAACGKLQHETEAAKSALEHLVAQLPEEARAARERFVEPHDLQVPDYAALVVHHNRRSKSSH